MKSPLRKVYASGSTRRLVEKLHALGWTPSNRDVLPRRERERLPVTWATGMSDFNAPLQMRRHDSQ